MRKILESAERFRIPEFRFEHDCRFQLLQNSALPRNAELFRKVRPDSRNRLKCKCFSHRTVYRIF